MTGIAPSQPKSKRPPFGPRRLQILALLVPILGTVAGCMGSHQPPKSGMLMTQAEVAQQKAVCRELRKLGAECDCDFWKISRVNVVLGDHWQDGSKGLSLLTQLVRVDELTLEGSAVTKDVMSCAASLPMLSVLHIRRASLTSEMAATLPRGEGIFGLELQDVTLDQQAWKNIYQLNLIWLTVGSCSIVLSDDSPAEGQIRRLVSLRLSGPAVDDATLRRAGRLSSLRQIVVRQGNVSSAGLQYLNSLRHLTHLDLATAQVKDLSGLDSSAIGNLQELVLDDTPATDDSLVPLARFTSLESISLNSTAVSDRGIQQLTALENLRFISLQGTGVTDAGLERLASIKKLITAIDAAGDMILFQGSWLQTSTGDGLPYWAARHSKKLYLWTEKGREPLELPADAVKEQKQEGAGRSE
jgi:hypothetical protein